MHSHSLSFKVSSRAKPVIELSQEGVYVSLFQGCAVAKTEVRSEWPLIAVDFDKTGRVIGVECAPCPEEFSLAATMRKAGGHIPVAAAARAVIKSPVPADSCVVAG